MKESESLKGRDVLTLLDFSTEEIHALLNQAMTFKDQQKNGTQPSLLQGKSLGMIFENASTRTRVSFEVGMTQLGGHALFLSPRDMQIGRGEPIKDTAKVLSRYVDAIMIRTNDHEKVVTLAEHADVPVINALTDAFHPCQALADLLTVKEQKGSFEQLQAAFIGDGNNVSHSWMIACAKVGMDVTIATPPSYGPNEEIVEKTKAVAKKSGATVKLTNDPKEAVTGADVIYTDVWTSMGYEEEQATRLAAFDGFQVNEQLVSLADDDFLFLHCLPAHRGEEVSESVIDGPRSYVYNQAENRLHAQKAILASVI